MIDPLDAICPAEAAQPIQVAIGPEAKTMRERGAGWPPGRRA